MAQAAPPAAPAAPAKPTEAAPVAAKPRAQARLEPADAKSEADAKLVAQSPAAAPAKSASAPNLQPSQADNALKPAAPVDAVSPPQPAPHARSAPDIAPPETRAPAPPPAAHQVAREIVRRFNGGATQFEIRLDPPELGRVEVRMEVSRDNRVTAVVTADSAQALTDLVRNARDIQDALQSAGLDLADDGLSFDLASRRDENAARTGAGSGGEANEESAQQPAAPARLIGLEHWRGVRVDLVA